MLKKEVAVALTVLSVVLCSVIASAAADVAYIYRKAFRVDDNIIDAFSDLGLTVDLIQEEDLPTDFSQYRLIFAGDENFREEEDIPVNDFPTIVANYYHTDVWGLTDEEGVSQLASTHPLSVVQNGQMIQVYTLASEGQGGPALSYYFLDFNNIAPSLEDVAMTETTASGSSGDVIAYANRGDQMLNGKIQDAKICFFGIIRTDFWTVQARQLFNECVAHVAAECTSDDDCSADSQSDPFCKDGNVVVTETTQSCEGAVMGLCVADKDDVVIEECAFGCEDGECIEVRCVIDEDCDDFNQSTDDVCHNPGTPGAFCSNNPISCFSNGDCGIDGLIGELFCSEGDVAQLFKTFTCNNPGTGGSFCSSSIHEKAIEECPDICVDGMCQPLHCESNAECDDLNSLTIDECLNPGTVISECRHTPINCASNSDCGFTGFIGVEFCSDSSVAKNFQNATCHNPNTTDSFCTIDVTTVIIEMCSDGCIDATCVVCSSDADCDDTDPNTVDSCHFPGTVDAFCTHEPIACLNDADCGIDGLIGELFCSEGDVAQLFENFTCHNAGTLDSFCRSETTTKIIEMCADVCINGACQDIACNANADCNDGDPHTFDLCRNPGTVDSECLNIPINCLDNNECGFTGFIGAEFCSDSSVAKNFQNATCHFPGTPDSFCTVDVSTVVINQCANVCFDGICINCNNNLDCDDSNSSTDDFCHNPGTVESFCTNEPDIPIICFGDEECGADTPVSELFCSGNEVRQLVNVWMCNNPGTVGSFCSSTIIEAVIEMCIEFCVNGGCIEINCFNNLDCNDNNETTRDLCNNPGTAESFCTNNPIEIVCSSNSECGTDRPIGEPFCSNNKVVQLFERFTCHNPGTGGSFCMSDLNEKEIEICINDCSQGMCIEFVCNANTDCNDNNPLTFDQCVHPGSNVAHCENTAVNCAENLDCGIDGFTGDEFCVGDNVYKNFQDATCNNPGLPTASCVVVVNAQLIDSCEFACTRGICIRCNTNADCNDANHQTQDVCIMPNTVNSYCQNTPNGECVLGTTRSCGVSDVGQCRLGVETCLANGQFGNCIGAVFPNNEVCDTVDNDCDGFIDENNVCVIPQCNDGHDNDGDGLIDYPYDQGCVSVHDDSELPFNFPQCDDGFDNDSDGKVDWPLDPQCSSRLDNNEST